MDIDKRIELLEKENAHLKSDLERIQSTSKQNTKRKKRVLKFLGHSFAGKRLKNSIYKVLNQYNEQQNVTRDAISDLLAGITYRVTRIGLFTLIFAILPSILLIQQNILLKQQNKKIQDQNYLAEASRRSGQMFIMGEVLSDLNVELKNGNRELSPTLIGRIASLSRAMQPYRYYENGRLIPEGMSPERGQLLVTISKSPIDKEQLSDEIFQNSDFTFANLENAKLRNAYLEYIHLDYANLSNADLVNTKLSYATLSNAILHNVDFTDATLKLTSFVNADLSNANLMFANIDNANFTNTNLQNVKVHRMDWLTYIKDKLKLKGAEALYNTYKIDSLYAGDLGRKVPTIIKK